MIVASYTLVGATQEQYDRVAGLLGGRMATRPGFRLHAAGPKNGCYDVVEVWDSDADRRAWYDDEVAPLLTPGTLVSLRIMDITNTIFPATTTVGDADGLAGRPRRTPERADVEEGPGSTGQGGG